MWRDEREWEIPVVQCLRLKATAWQFNVYSSIHDIVIFYIPQRTSRDTLSIFDIYRSVVLKWWVGGGDSEVSEGCEGQGRMQSSISTGYLSTALHLHHASGADKFHFHFSLCVNFQQVRCAACLLRPAPESPLAQIRRTSIYLADARAWHSNSAEFCTEQTASQAQKYQSTRPVTFQNKLLRADASKKRQTQALLLIPRSWTI